MDSSFNSFSKVVTKHVMGSQDRFNELKERLEMCEHATSKAGAAALGYLMAMEEKESPSTIYDLVLEQVEDSGTNSYARTDAIFAAMHQWLENILLEDGYKDGSYIREFLKDKFERYMP
jgi:hypothetical protein